MKPSHYQESRKALLNHIDRLRSMRDELVAKEPLFMNNLPPDVRQKMLLLDRESTRLRNPDLAVAFVGGFSAGKSSLVNAFLGRYLLPESTKVTTAVPTFVRSTTGSETAELHYLNEAEAELLGEMYRREIANLFNLPELVSTPYSNLMQQVQPLVREGRGRRLVEQFEIYQTQKQNRKIDPRGRIENVSLHEAHQKIRDETEAMFLDRVVLHINGSQIPEDIVLVDLPGVSVPNPRHREITFRFVSEEAHAVVFVLMATRLFDKDEGEILEVIRAGESHIAEKTFWVLNRWDSLSLQQQHQTVADFEAKMHETEIPNNYQWFRTNALHGLLAQLCACDELPNDPALQSHLKDYMDALEARYGGSHETAKKESQLPQLQEQVFQFINDRLRQTTLRSAVQNARDNFCEPLPSHLRQTKDNDDALINGDLRRKEKEQSQQRVDDRYEQRKADLDDQFKSLGNEISSQRSEVFRTHAKELIDQLQTKIADGPETDAYTIYNEIINSHGRLRKYPYHFEIELRIVDNLNTILKHSFRDIVRNQASEIFNELVKRVKNALVKISEDVGHDPEIMKPFNDVMYKGHNSFIERIDGIVMDKAAELDASLLYKPKDWLGLHGGNKILDGLEQAARLGFENIQDASRSIERTDMEHKTKKIRETLHNHYIDQVSADYNRIIKGFFPIIISNLHQIKDEIFKVLATKYRPALDIRLAHEIEEEFAGQRKDLEERSRRFRTLIEQIELISREMGAVLVGAG
ncbi:MAG: hypothetical protein EKK68_10485 [Candidatus Competibacteraceae bacterium]|nr:MAG: hypothetical protein EKK68_10485 [Candidatus Competibacteraceae bacterium]